MALLNSSFLPLIELVPYLKLFMTGKCKKARVFGFMQQIKELV